MKELRYGKWSSQMATAEEVTAFRKEAREMVEKYGWEHKVVFPYSRPEPVMDIVNFGDYDHSSHGSKVHICQMLNGLIPIFEAWEETELTGVDVKVLKTGKVKRLPKEDAEFLIENGICEIASREENNI